MEDNEMSTKTVKCKVIHNQAVHSNVTKISNELIVFILLALGCISMGCSDNTSQEKLYVAANGLNIRSSMTSSSDHNIVGKEAFGTPVKLIERKGEWVYVQSELFGKGYMSCKYLISEQEFWELDGIYGNQEARDRLRLTRNKKALQQYFETNGFMGFIPENVQKEIYGEIQNKEVWQIFAQPKGIEGNTVWELNMSKGKYKDFACIITNKSKRISRILVFEAGNSSDETPMLVLEHEFDDVDILLRHIRKGKKGGRWDLGWRSPRGGMLKEYLPSNGLITSGRVREDDSPTFAKLLIYYNGGILKTRWIDEIYDH